MKSLTVLYTLALVIFFISTVSAASFNKQRYVRGSKPARTTVKATATIPKATTTTKSSTTAAPTSPAGSGTVYSGDGTWFDIGLGSCGQVNTDDELVAALNAPQMMNGANPNNNPMCGRMIKVTNPATNKSVTVKIVDTCPPCVSGSVDLSPAAFSAISNLDVGRIKINWIYV
ncbi:hypothetical protein MFLAVUS_003474 [Mucor flavus]|uniref:RlpA-like protein double-psi beta-barrel domain-containing protein n=1 Tax=Mucor flavus TaxID=439312 RepID=A0ABP9YT70_9FUNG